MALFPGASRAPLSQSAALAVLLQHKTVHADVQAVLQMCCTSKAIRAAVLQHCKGQLNISYQLTSHSHAQQFAAWLVRCGRLAGSLRCWLPDVQCRWRYTDVRTEEEAYSMLERAEQVIAAALVQLQRKEQRAQELDQDQHQHQRRHNGLQLHTLAWHRIGTSRAAAELLEVLPNDKLLQLVLSQEEAMECEPASSAGISAGSIAALTQLQSLSVYAAVDVEQLQWALPALTALTDLCITTASNNRCSRNQFAVLQQQLPVQLRALTLEVEHDRHGGPLPLQLSHLSCVGRLNTLLVEEGSQLPQHLLHLQCSSCQFVQPLLSCPQLQHIDLHWSRSSADELCQLSRLTRLTHLSLCYAEHMYPGIADAAADAWPRLAHALKDLKVTGLDPASLAEHSLKQLQHLHGLTRLSIEATDDVDGGNTPALLLTPVQCAEVLAGLTALRTLELSMDPGRHLLLHEQLGVDDAAAAAVAGVQAAAAGLQAAQAAVAGAAGALAVGDQAVLEAVNMVADHAHMLQAQMQAVGGAALAVAGVEAGQAAAAAAAAIAAQLAAPPAGQQNWEQAQQAALQGQQLLQALQPHIHQLMQHAQPSPSPNMLPVTRVIAQLPHLDSLELKGSGLSLETVEPLTVLTQLTRLTMSGCDCDEAAFNSLALSLTGLRRLSIGGSELVGDAGLVVVARVLPQLTRLNVRSCSKVTDRGVLQLRSLRRLQVLLAEDTAVSRQVAAGVLRGAPQGAQ